MMTTNKIDNGHFEVLWNGEATEYTIVNGSLGQSGKEPNVYGTINQLTGKTNWHGSIQRCKALLKFTLAKRSK